VAGGCGVIIEVPAGGEVKAGEGGAPNDVGAGLKPTGVVGAAE